MELRQWNLDRPMICFLTANLGGCWTEAAQASAEVCSRSEVDTADVGARCRQGEERFMCSWV